MLRLFGNIIKYEHVSGKAAMSDVLKMEFNMCVNTL